MEDEQVRADLRQAMAAGETERVESITVRYGTALAQRAVPEWQATLDALQPGGVPRSGNGPTPGKYRESPG